jgi:transcriptional regulator with XRE-family HTH domain
MPSAQPASRNVNQRIADRVRRYRAALRLSLDELADKCGVSRSMISLIERARCSPTAAVLEKLAAGLNVTLASLFDAISGANGPSDPVARRREQLLWRDPASGYVRRNVSPPGEPQPVQIVEILFPPGRRVALDCGPRDAQIFQQIWVLAGSINITVGSQRHQLRQGDCLAMRLGAPTMFHNPTRKPARYAVVISRPTPGPP